MQEAMILYNALEYHIFEDSIIFSIFSLFIKDRMPYTKYKWLNQFTIIVVKIQYNNCPDTLSHFMGISGIKRFPK